MPKEVSDSGNSQYAYMVSGMEPSPQSINNESQVSICTPS